MAEEYKDYDVRVSRARIEFDCCIVQVKARSREEAKRFALEHGGPQHDWEPTGQEPILGQVFVRSEDDVLDLSGDDGDFEVLEKRLAWAEGVIAKLKEWSGSSRGGHQGRVAARMIEEAEVAKP